MKRYITALSYTTILFRFSAQVPARADRDIVYAAETYRMSGHYYRDPNGGKPEETLERVSPSHLYRINPDGSGRKQLTFGDLDGKDYDPHWSPDGKSILFLRCQPRVKSEKYTVCVIGQNGGALRRLVSLRDVSNLTWSPDGRQVVVCSKDYFGEDRVAHVIDLQTGTDRKLLPCSTYAWSPDSQRLFLCTSDYNAPQCYLWSRSTDRVIRIPTSLRDPVWQDSRTIIGDTPAIGGEMLDQSLRVVSTDGRQVRRIYLRPAPRLKPNEDIEFYFANNYEIRQWYRVPHSKKLLAQACHNSTDGSHNSCYLIDLNTGTLRLMYPGMLVGMSPDGTKFAAAAHKWVGPYKRGGERVGALTIVSLKTGKETPITSPLISVSGGDWRSATK